MVFFFLVFPHRKKMFKVNLSLKFYTFYAILQMVGISYGKYCLVNFESEIYI